MILCLRDLCLSYARISYECSTSCSLKTARAGNADEGTSADEDDKDAEWFMDVMDPFNDGDGSGNSNPFHNALLIRHL